MKRIWPTFRLFPRAANPRLLALLLGLSPFLAGAQTVVISEIMADNRRTFPDGSGLFPDWLELHNLSSSPVNLGGWKLTDDGGLLNKWTFPDRVLPANGFLVLFASGRNRVDAAGYFHTNFKLDPQGEYLALVRPDLSIASEFSPVLPPQQRDVSFGPGFAATLSRALAVGAVAHVKVPTDDALGTDWLAPGFDDSDWDATLPRPGNASVLITEAGLGSPHFIEIQNVTDRAVDTTGWVVAVNDSGEVNQVNPGLWSLPARLTPGERAFRTDEPGPRFFGGTIGWTPNGRGWIVLLQPTGAVVDFVAWGYSRAEVAGISTVINGHQLGTGGFLDDFDYADNAALSSVWTGPVLSGLKATNIVYNTGGAGRLEVTDMKDSSNSSGTAKAAFTHTLPVPIVGDFTATMKFSWDFPVGGFLGGVFLEAWRTAAILASGGLQDDNAGGAAQFGFRYGQIGGTSSFVSASGTSDASLSPESMTGAQRTSHQGNTLISPAAQSIISASATASRGTATIELTRIGSNTRVRWLDPDRAWILVEYAAGNTNPLTALNLEINFWWYLDNTFPTISIDQVALRTPLEGASLGWDGAGVTSEADPGFSLQRIGDADRDGPADFAWRPSSLGTPNGELSRPFAVPSVRTGLGYDRGRELSDLARTDLAAAAWNQNSSIYVRLPFSISAPDVFASRLRVQYDAGFVAYLDGREIARRHAPESLSWNAAATAGRSDEAARSFEEIDLFGRAIPLAPGPHVLALQGLNESATDEDFLLVPELDVASVPPGSAGQVYFAFPTPGEPNSAGSHGLTDAPKFDPPGAALAVPITLTLTSTTPGAAVHYTVDGTPPLESSPLYTGPFPVSSTGLIRAKAFAPGLLPSVEEAQAYLLIDPSLSTRSSNLPLLLLDSQGQGVAETDATVPTPILAWLLDPGSSNRVTLTDPAEFAGRAGLKVHGSSSVA